MDYLQKKGNIIVDINDELIEKLTDEEKAFCKNITDKQKELFLYMAKADRQKLMSGCLSKEDEELTYKYASTLALHYINDEYFVKPAIEKIPKYAKYLLCAALVCFSFDLFFNVYAKNKQLHIETFEESAKYELIPSFVQTINANRQNINSSENLMTLDTFTQYISSKDFECSSLDDLSKSFYQSSGKPFCKTGLNGDVFVAGYVLNPSFPQPVFLVIHEGNKYNIDLNKESGITFADIPGAQKLSFNNISYTFQKAFPEAVRVSAVDVVTKRLEQKQ